MAKPILMLLSLVAVLGLIVGCSFSAPDGHSKISADVLSALAEQDEVRVLVKLRDGADTAASVRGIAAAALPSEVKTRHVYSAVKGFSAAVSRGGLERLQRDSNVEYVYPDRLFRIALQDSVPLVNASAAWNMSYDGYSITGLGQTVCILDTGIDYMHSDLGGCTLAVYNQTGTSESFVLESAHPYADNFDYTWNITKPGYSRIAVHFVNISLEYPGQWEGYDSFDRIIVYDYQHKEIARYHGISGIITDLWTPYSEGDTIYIRLVSDSGISDYGFYIDQVRNGTTNTTYNWENCTKVVGGWDFVNNDGDPMDDHGHGTHVAGIVAANGAIKGVAPEATLVAQKVLNAAGSGWDSDITAGIDWCVNHSADYNISVISMSLGGGLYPAYCDSEFPLLAASVDAAVAKNVSVVIATGNSGSSSYISAPACIYNATAVAATTKSDTVASLSNTNNITDLLAPGISINSTYLSGSYNTLSGTSMATPHVSGAIALLRQFMKIQANAALTPAQAEVALKATGKNLTDADNNLTFPRINVLAALLYLDTFPPSIAYVNATPANDTRYNTTPQNITINITANERLSNATLVWDNGTPANYSMTRVTDTNWVADLADVGEGTHLYTAYGTDIAGNSGQGETRKITVDATAPIVSFVPPSPEGSSIVNYSTIIFNVSHVESNPDALQLYIDGMLNESAGYSGAYSSFIRVLADGVHNFSVTANDTVGHTSSTETRFVTIDTVPPAINFTSPTPNNETYSTTNTVVINMTFSEPISSLTFEFDGYNNSLGEHEKSENVTSAWLIFADLDDGNHTFRAYVRDFANWTGASETRYVVINVTQNQSAYFNQVNATNSANNVTTILRFANGTIADAANVSAAKNYTFEFDASGIIVNIANFSWVGANTSGIVNVTTSIATANVNSSFAAAGGALDAVVWTDMNGFLAANYTPIVTFPRAYRIFFYLNGSRTDPIATRIGSACNQNFTNKPCYVLGDSYSSAYLLAFSGVAAGNDTQAPAISITSPANGASLSSTSVTLAYTASDNVAIDKCFYSLNGGANTTLANCAGAAIMVATGSNTLIVYANDTSGNINSSAVSFTVTIPQQPSGGGGGGAPALANIATQSWDFIYSEAPASMVISVPGIAAKRILLYAKSTQANVKIEVMGSNVSAIAPKAEVYQYLIVSKTNLLDAAIAKADIEFEIDRSWFTEKKLSPTGVKLMRYNETTKEWQSFAAQMLSQNETALRYRATVPALSLFAIAAEPEEEKQLCIQVITPAVNKETGECKEWPTPCDVPEGWTIVRECPAAVAPFENIAINITQNATCPACPNPSEWSACENGTQSRTEYYCSAETNWTCVVRTASQWCLGTQILAYAAGCAALAAILGCAARNLRRNKKRNKRR